MLVGIDYGNERVDLEVREKDLVKVRRSSPAPPLTQPAEVVRAALESPAGFPALRRALTPDDHVVVVLDEHCSRLPDLVIPVLQHVTEAGVTPQAISVLCPPLSSPLEWTGTLPRPFQDVSVEVHDPSDRKRLSYLATTRRGRRIYLNRTAVDADQLVVLCRRSFDPLLGYSGAEGALYPALTDEPTRQEMCKLLSLATPGPSPWPARQEAVEVAWLLGAPFFVQIIEGPADSLVHVVSGLTDTGEESLRLLNAEWRVGVDAPADMVVAGISGNPNHHTFSDLGEALACAARVVKPQGRIVLLSRALPSLGAGAELLRQADDPAQALRLIRKNGPADMAAAFAWASAAERAAIYLLSALSSEVAEELFAIPLDHSGQVQRLLDAAGSCLFLPDAHKTLAVVANGSRGQGPRVRGPRT
jgi:nickel-dependent lactate racemase